MIVFCIQISFQGVVLDSALNCKNMKCSYSIGPGLTDISCRYFNNKAVEFLKKINFNITKRTQKTTQTIILFGTAREA